MSHSGSVNLPPISELNALPEEDFLHVCNILFETAPPLASALLKRRPYASYDALIDAAGIILCVIEFLLMFSRFCGKSIIRQ